MKKPLSNVRLNGLAVASYSHPIHATYLQAPFPEAGKRVFPYMSTAKGVGDAPPQGVLH